MPKPKDITEIIGEVFDEMEILRASPVIASCDTWQLGADSFAVLLSHPKDPRVWLIVPNALVREN